MSSHTCTRIAVLECQLISSENIKQMPDELVKVNRQLLYCITLWKNYAALKFTYMTEESYACVPCHE